MSKFALLGAGYWSQILAKTAKKISMDIKRFHDPDLSKNIEGAAASSLKEILEDNDIIGVLIASPPATHFELANKCLNAGKHVFVEKPICLSSKDATELIYLAEKQKKTLFADNTFLYSAEVDFLKLAIARLTYGRPRLFRSTRTNFAPNFSEHSDCSVLHDLLVHDLTITSHLFGSPDYISATAAKVGSKLDDANVRLEYKNFNCDIHVSWLGADKIRKFELVTDRAIIVIENGQVEINHFNGTVEEAIELGTFFTPLQLELTEFKERAELNQFSAYSAMIGHRAVQLIEKAEESINNRREVKI